MNIYTSPGVSDYVFCTGMAGYGAAEAKSTKSESLPRKRIEPLQARHLDHTARVRALALLLVEFRLPDDVYHFAIPWLQVPWSVARTAESLTLSDALAVRPYCTVVPGQCYLSRYLQPARDSDGYVIDFRDKRVYPRG